MKFKRLLMLVMVFCFSICTTGCGEALYTMTDKEEEVVALYAAKMVTKFNKNQTTGICNARVKDGELPTNDVDDEIPVEDLVDNNPVVDPDTGDIVSGNTEELDISEGYSFTDAIGVDGMEFSCSSFDVTEEFNTSSSFVLTQVKGKKYLVLYIDGVNTTGDDISFNSKGVKYSLTIGGNTSSTQFSFASNDLSTFDGKVSAGESKQFVLVFQFNNSIVENISSLSLEVSDNGEVRVVTL